MISIHRWSSARNQTSSNSGWMQQVNFIIFGLLVLCSTYGWYQALKPGVGSIWYPLLKAITGLGLIVDGFFSQDPAPGYPGEDTDSYDG